MLQPEPDVIIGHCFLPLVVELCTDSRLSSSFTLGVTTPGELFNNASIDTCSLLAKSDGLETDESRHIGLTLLNVSSMAPWDWYIMVNIQNKVIRIRLTQYYVGMFFNLIVFYKRLNLSYYTTKTATPLPPIASSEGS